jgi:hypothetical protein
LRLTVRDIEERVRLPGTGIKPWQILRKRRLMEKVAHLYKERLKDAIITQQMSYTWVPHTKAYQQHKVRTGLDPRIWVATHTLVEAIMVRKSGWSYSVEVDRNAKHENGTPLPLIVKALEYGTRTIPPRPLFRPVLERLVEDLERLIPMWIKEGAI